MAISRKWLIFIITIFAILVLTSCQEPKNANIDEQGSIDTERITANSENNGKELMNDALSSDDNIHFGIDAPVNIENLEDINMDDFFDSPILGIKENEIIKHCIIDMILYMHGYEMEKDILYLIDKEASKDFITDYGYREEGWTMINELLIFRNNNLERQTRLSSIDANFMLKLNFFEKDGEEYLSIYTPFYPYDEKDGKIFGRMIYDFYLKKIDGSYVFVGLFLTS